MTHIIKKKIKFLDLKSTINEMNNSLEVLKARFELTKKKKISENEDSSIEIIQPEEQKEKGMKQN